MKPGIIDIKKENKYKIKIAPDNILTKQTTLYIIMRPILNETS